LEQSRFSLDMNQLLLKGANLKNSKWVIGFVVYTGEETRIMMNSKFKNKPKLAQIDKNLNGYVAQIFAMQIFLSFVSSFMGVFVQT
jgi:magnesium-transporting ATPase (P-type)